MSTRLSSIWERIFPAIVWMKDTKKSSLSQKLAAAGMQSVTKTRWSGVPWCAAIDAVLQFTVPENVRRLTGLGTRSAVTTSARHHGAQWQYSIAELETRGSDSCSCSQGFVSLCAVESSYKIIWLHSFTEAAENFRIPIASLAPVTKVIIHRNAWQNF